MLAGRAGQSSFFKHGCHKGLEQFLSVRTVVGVRKLLSEFIRTVHPDLTPSFPLTARRINQQSLGELNAFVDSLESQSPPPFEAGPEVARSLPFFRAQQTRNGRKLPGRVLPLHLPLPSLPVAASELDREYAAARLIRDAEVILEHSASAFSEDPSLPPLFTAKGASRAAFDTFWWQQTREEIVRECLYGPDDEQVRRQVAMKVFAKKYEYQLLRRYTSIKHPRRRRQKLAGLETKVEEKLQARFGTAHPVRTVEQEQTETEAVARVLQSGFHPDLVFVAPDVGEAERREAIRRVCGMDLESDADFWLLENLWKAMRSTPPPVPLVVAMTGYQAHVDAGFVQVPWNFTVAGLCDLLEEHLDDVRAGLLRRRSTTTRPMRQLHDMGLLSQPDFLDSSELLEDESDTDGSET